MAYPLIGVIIAAAATAAKIAADRERAEQMAEKEAQEMRRQQGFQRQAEQEFSDSLSKAGYEPAQAAIDQATKDRQATYQHIAQTPLAGSTASPLVGEVQSVARTTRSAGSTQRAQTNQAAMGAYSDWAMQQAVKNARVANQLATLNSLARSSAAVLPFELQQAQSKQGSLDMASTILGSLGSIMGAAGGSGGGG